MSNISIIIKPLNIYRLILSYKPIEINHIIISIIKPSDQIMLMSSKYNIKHISHCLLCLYKFPIDDKLISFISSYVVDCVTTFITPVSK